MTKESFLPAFDQLPSFNTWKGCAWSIWNNQEAGYDVELGTVNLLTPDLVKRAAEEEIRTGRMVSLNWPINFPYKAMFGRKDPDIVMAIKKPGPQGLPKRDDEINISTQSGSHWIGLKYMGLQKEKVHYNNTAEGDVKFSFIPPMNPSDENPKMTSISIHRWAEHGISGRGVLLDMKRYFSSRDSQYGAQKSCAFSVDQLEDCARVEGVTFRWGDILLIRGGFIEWYHTCQQEERDALPKYSNYAGIDSSDNMKRFLWNNHFAAIGGDQPNLEVMPIGDDSSHMSILETIIPLFGMPVGKLFDLEQLSRVCEETGRYAFFFTSWPLNIIGGCASTANAAAYF